MLIELLGVVALVVLSLAAVPQAIRALREGHAKGLSWSYLLLAFFGFLLMLVYTILSHKGFVLGANYATQLVLFGLMIWRKAYPRDREYKTSSPAPSE